MWIAISIKNGAKTDPAKPTEKTNPAPKDLTFVGYLLLKY